MTRRNNLTKRGFTVLEVTIAVSIIAILAGLLIYGIGHLSASSKGNATRIMLGSDREILGEFDTGPGLGRDTGNWPWAFFADTSAYPPPPSVISVVPPGNATSIGVPSATPLSLSPSYWTAPWRYQSPSSTGGSLTSGDAAAPMLAVTGNYSTDGPSLIRNASPAVLYTQLGIKMMGGLTACRTMLSSIPSGSTMIPEYQSGCTWYAIGNTVKVTTVTGSGTSVVYYQCQINNPASGPPSANWLSVTNADPVLLDAWGNPILLVPSSGLVNVWTNISKSNPIPNPPPPWGSAPTGGQIQTWVATKSQALLAYQQPPIIAPDNKPFFVSAGPDGDFTAGDDNIYSFNK